MMLSPLQVLTFLICFVSVIEGNCFKEGQPQKYIDEDYGQLRRPVLEKCKNNNQKATEVEVEKCADDIIAKAAKECVKIVPDVTDQSNWFICFSEKLGAEKPTEKDLSFDFYKTELLEIAADESKEKIVSALDECKSVTDFWECGYKKLAEGPCPETKPIYDQMMEWKKLTQ